MDNGPRSFMQAEPSAPAEPRLRVLSAETFRREELLARLRQTRLRGFDGAQPYAEATLSLSPATDPADLAPAQRYVLKAGVARILELRDALLEHGIDMFALDGGAFVRTSEAPEETVPVIPPIVEESHEPDGRLVLIINDGIHRVFAARSIGLPITTVIAGGVPREYPYYACATSGGWSEVVELEELPDGFEKKAYRMPENYKALFREFNEVFPGVQKERKKSNPAHLRA
jgi:hypothetical protein